MTRRVQLAALITFSAALAIRMEGIGSRPFWLDEAATMGATFSGGLGDLLSGVAETEVGKAPLYYLALRGWGHIFGKGEGALRALSALCGALASLGAFAWAAALNEEERDDGSNANGWFSPLIGGSFIALHPLMISLSRDARSYAMSHTFLFSAMALSVPAWISKDRVPFRGSLRILVAVLAAAGTCCHLFSGFFAVGGILAVLWVRRGHTRVVEGLFPAALVYALLVLTEVPLIIVQVGGYYGSGATARSLEWRDYAHYALELFGGGWPGAVLAAVCCFAVAQGPSKLVAKIGCLTALLSLGLFFAVHSCVRPILIGGPRYIAWSTGTIALVLCSVPAQLERRRIALVLALGVAMVAAAVRGRRMEAAYAEDWREVARVVQEQERPGDVVGVYASHVRSALTQYYRGNSRLVGLHPQYTPGTGPDLSQVRQGLDPGARIWIVWSHQDGPSESDLEHLRRDWPEVSLPYSSYTIHVILLGHPR